MTRATISLTKRPHRLKLWTTGMYGVNREIRVFRYPLVSTFIVPLGISAVLINIHVLSALIHLGLLEDYLLACLLPLLADPVQYDSKTQRCTMKLNVPVVCVVVPLI